MSRLLLIDDDEDILSSYTLILQKEGHQVLVAQSAEMALEVLKSEELDLVVTDLLLPGMDGAELCRIIRREEAWSHLPVVLITCMRERMGVEITSKDSFWAPFARIIDKSSAVTELPKAVMELTKNRDLIGE